MNTLENLTEWDFAVIYYVKQETNQKIDDIKKIWRERCDLPDDYEISSGDLINHFLPIVVLLGEKSKSSKYSFESIVQDAAPKNSWMFRDMTSKDETCEDEIYYNRIFTVICSRLRLSEVKYLPGFDAYYNKRKGIVSLKLP
jgi:hypothetical protein